MIFTCKVCGKQIVESEEGTRMTFCSHFPPKSDNVVKSVEDVFDNLFKQAKTYDKKP